MLGRPQQHPRAHTNIRRPLSEAHRALAMSDPMSLSGGTATRPLVPNLPSGQQEHQRAARRRPSDWALARPWLGVGELRNNA
jgi:hypothetical protein